MDGATALASDAGHGQPPAALDRSWSTPATNAFRHLLEQ
jgi:hypothetical protein